MADQENDPLIIDLAEPLLDQPEHAEAGCAGAAGASPGGATVLQTVALLLSVYVGLGLLSQPYAVKLGGWAALALLGGTIALFTTSALLMPKAFALLPPGIPHSYPELGAAALRGRRGKSLVAALAGLELFGGATIALVVVYGQIELLLPSEGILGFTPPLLAVALATAALVPMLAAKDVSRLSLLSAVGSSASCLVVAAVLSLLLIDPHRSKLPLQPPAGHRAATGVPGALQSVGIFAVSASGHSVLPALRGAMQEPGRFPAAVVAAFSAMGAVYALVAGVGYWYWGEAVSAVLTFDLSTNSPFAHPGGAATWRDWLAVDRLLAGLVLINCASKVPALVMVVEELLLGLLVLPVGGEGAGAALRRPRVQVQYAARTLVAASAVVLSYSARDALGPVLSLVGGACSMATSLVMPMLFYASLSWGGQPAAARVALAALIAFSAALSLLVTGLNVHQIGFGGGGAV